MLEKHLKNMTNFSKKNYFRKSEQHKNKFDPKK